MKTVRHGNDGTQHMEVEFEDGMIQSALTIAQVFARQNDCVVAFEFMGTPIRLTADSNLADIHRLYNYNRDVGIGHKTIEPVPDMSQVPEWGHGTIVVSIGR